MTSLAYVYIASTRSEAFTVEQLGGKYSLFKFHDTTIVLSNKPFDLVEVGRFVEAKKLAIKTGKCSDGPANWLDAGPLCQMVNLVIAETE